MQFSIIKIPSARTRRVLAWRRGSESEQIQPHKKPPDVEILRLSFHGRFKPESPNETSINVLRLNPHSVSSARSIPVKFRLRLYMNTFNKSLGGTQWPSKPSSNLKKGSMRKRLQELDDRSSVIKPDTARSMASRAIERCCLAPDLKPESVAQSPHGFTPSQPARAC